LLFVLAYVLGSAAKPASTHAHETARSWLELAFGVALVVVGAMVWFRPPRDAPQTTDSRTRLVLDRLAHLSLPAVFGAGVALALGPKRLGLTVLVTATIATSDVGTVEGLSLSVFYVVVATALVTVPVVLAIVFGDRAEQWMLEVEHWLSAHKRPLTFYPVTILGVLVIVDALLGLT
jgi:hypothetical protein